MKEVVRWGNFPDYGQTLVEHNNSVCLVGRWVVAQVQPPVKERLLADAFMVHDHGEPPTGGDEHADNKTDGKEVREWEAFAELLSAPGLPRILKQEWRTAFLLQYCRKPYDKWFTPEVAREIGDIHALYPLEAAIFDFTERLDYLLSAYEGYCHGIHNETETMIDHTLRLQVPKLDALAEEYRHVLGVIWRPQLRQSFMSLVE